MNLIKYLIKYRNNYIISIIMKESTLEKVCSFHRYLQRKSLCKII